MHSVKTAISIQQNLFEKLNHLAEELQVSRSRLVTMAVEDFINQKQQQKMLSQINQAYADQPDADETRRFSAMRKKHQQSIEPEAW